MKKTAQKVDDFLADLAGGRVTVEEAFEYREDGGIRIALPQVPNKMSLKRAANMLLQQAEAEEATYEFTMQIQCRPYDGAFAFNKVIKELYGMTAIGRAIHGFFGSQPPQLKLVHVSAEETVQVPYGLVEFPPWGSQFHLQEYWDNEYGLAFQIYVLAKKKKERQVQGLLQLVEKYVVENSLYRGKAMRGVVVRPEKPEPEFYDPYEIDRTTVVYSKDVFEALVDQVWGVIECADLFRQSNKGFQVVDSEGNPLLHNGQPVFEKTHIRIGNNVLLHGENGTGKT